MISFFFQASSTPFLQKQKYAGRSWWENRSKFIFFLTINLHAAKVNLTLGRAKPTFFTRWTRPLCLFRILGRPCRPARLLATGWGQAANNVTSGADQQARKTRPENNWKNETKRKQKNRTENYCKSEAILVPRIYRVFLAVHSLQVHSAMFLELRLIFSVKRILQFEQLSMCQVANCTPCCEKV